MCELLGIFKPLIIIQVPLSLTVVRFKCNLSDNPLAFERVIKGKPAESQRARENRYQDITNLPKKAFNMFKRVLRKLLFDILQMGDDFMEIPLIIKKSRYIDTLAKCFNSCFSCLHALYISKRFILELLN